MIRLVPMCISTEGMMVPSQPTLPRANQGNVDTTPIDNQYGVAAYTAYYVSKQEPQTVKELQALLGSLPEDTHVTTAWQKVLMSALGFSATGAQMACHIMLGQDIIKTSRPVKPLFIPYRDTAYEALVDPRTLDEKPTALQQYLSRDLLATERELVGLKEMSFFEWTRGKSNLGNVVDIRPPLCFNVAEDAEAAFRVLCCFRPMLGVDEYEALRTEKDDDLQCQAAALLEDEQCLASQFRHRFEARKEAMNRPRPTPEQFDVSDDGDCETGDEFGVDEFGPTDLEAELPSPEDDENDESYVFPGGIHAMNNPTISTVTMDQWKEAAKWQSTLRKQPPKDHIADALLGPDKPPIVHTPQQKHIIDDLSSILDDNLHRSGAPLRGVLAGPGGSGKSEVVKALCGMYECCILAPTGVAAFNVHGKTIHTGLHIPIGASPEAELSEDVMKKLAATLKDVELIIIDEYGAVGDSVFQHVIRRLSAARPDGTRLGKFNVLLVGDPLQIPPTRQNELWQPGGTAIAQQTYLSQFTRIHVLEGNQRSEDPVWAGILARWRVGELTAADLAMLNTRSCKAFVSMCANRQWSNMQLQCSTPCVASASFMLSTPHIAGLSIPLLLCHSHLLSPPLLQPSHIHHVLSSLLQHHCIPTWIVYHFCSPISST